MNNYLCEKHAKEYAEQIRESNRIWLSKIGWGGFGAFVLGAVWILGKIWGDGPR
jgi:hypothetical protein